MLWKSSISGQSGRGIIRDNRVPHYRDRRNQRDLDSAAQVPLFFLNFCVRDVRGPYGTRGRRGHAKAVP